MDILGVKEKYEGDLMQMPNVIGVGIAEKGGKPVIKVLVTQKVSEASLRPQEIIPKTLDGYETDVEESGTITVQNTL